jgi:hypothetical protein
MRRWLVAAAVPFALLAGCAQGGSSGAPPSGSGDADFDRRAAEVAEAWRASGAGAAWRDAFVPLGDLTVLPPDAGFSNDTKLAYGNGWFRSNTQLSTKAQSGGSIRFADGKVLSVPLVSAADAYRAIDKGDPPCNSDGGIPPAVQTDGPENPPAVKGKAMPAQCTALTVAGVKLGTVQLRTSRGEATVPAWLFTVDEMAGPLARVAVAPTATKALPSGGPVITGLDSVTVDGARLTYPIEVGCVKDVTPLVYEAEDVVVVGAKSTPVDGVCPLVAKTEPVTITLKAPLGDRIVLNERGQPLRRAD